MKAKLYKIDNDNFILVNPAKGVYDKGYLIGTSRESEVSRLSIKNCQAIERSYGFDKQTEWDVIFNFDEKDLDECLILKKINL